MSALRQPGDRRRACEVVEIAHQMRLIGVTAGRGDIRPTAARAAFRERHDAIESNDAGKRLWPEADLSIEPGDEVLAAPADFSGVYVHPSPTSGRRPRPPWPKVSVPLRHVAQ